MNTTGIPARGVSATLLAALLSLPGGCGSDRSPQRYVVVSGTVIACRADTGELSVELTGLSRQRVASAPLNCVVTKHSEIYINDKFSSINEIQIGDAVELVGNTDPDRRLENFVVRFAYCNHPAPPPSMPPLLAAEGEPKLGGPAQAIDPP